MTAYGPFFAADFAGRCLDLLGDDYWNQARFQDREVTLLLTIASAGLVVPYERLTRPKTNEPSLDRVEYSKEIEKFRDSLDKSIKDAIFFEGANLESWRFEFLKSAEGVPDDWPEFREYRPIDPDIKALAVVKLIRHGLAHGNIFMHPPANEHGGRSIENLVMVAGYTDKKSGENRLRFLAVTPYELRRFLHAWLCQVQELELDRKGVRQALD